MSNKNAHLGMIQGVINRLSQNSFLLKGWSVVLISALFALATKDSNSNFLYLACLPSLVFWGLDGWFLRQEKLFRKLYDRIRTIEEPQIDFSMNKSIVEDQVSSWLKVSVSKTLLAFHGVLFGSIVVIAILDACEHIL